MKTLKKTLAWFAALCMVLAFLPTLALRVSAAPQNFGTNLTWDYDSGTKTLTIAPKDTGKGSMPTTLTDSNRPWQSHKNDIKKVIIADGVTNISEEAFYQFTTITSVQFGKDIETIGSTAFSGCTELEAADLSAVKADLVIATSAFTTCTSITSVIFPESLKEIGEAAFSLSISLASIEFLKVRQAVSRYHSQIMAVHLGHRNSGRSSG